MNPRTTLALAFFLPALACSYPAHSFVTSYSVSFDFKAERTVTLPLDATAGRSLRVETAFGTIHARATAGCATPQAKVRLVVHGRTKEEADAALARFEVRATEAADGITLGLHGEPLAIDDGSVHVQLQPSADFDIEVADGVTLHAKAATGDLTADGPFASASLDSKFGAVSATGIRGRLDLNAGSGEIRIANCAGDVHGQSSYGNVSATGIEGEAMELSTSSGDIEVADAKLASLRLRTKFGKLTVQKTVAALDLETGSGDLRIVGTDGSLRAFTQYGSIDAEGVWQRIDVRTGSGPVSVRAENGSAATSGWKLESQYGAVALAVPAEFACMLDLETKWGDAECAFEVVVPAGGSPQNGRLAGKVGTGGATVRLVSGSGDVALRKLPAR